MATQPTNLPVPSESPRDLKFNAGKIDEFVTSLVNTYTDRFGNEHYTIEGLRWLAKQAIAQYGWILIDSFQDGADITLPNQALRDEDTGEYYRWDGEFPKVVTAGSTPDSSGGIGVGAWIGIGDASLRTMLASSAGASKIGMSSGFTLQEEFDDFEDGIEFLYQESPKNNMNIINARGGKTIKIATWNTWGIFSINAYYGLMNISSPQRIHDMQEAFLSSTPDIIGFQELIHGYEAPFRHWEIYPLSESRYYGFTTGVESRPGYSEGVGQLAKGIVKEYSQGAYPSTSGTDSRGYQRMLLDINGVEIAFYNTHIHANGNIIPLQISDLANILSVDNSERIVITADWNTSDMEVLKPISDLGFNFSQGSEFNTSNTEGVVWYIDNIAYKGFKSQKDVGVIEVSNTLSDHKLFYAELEV